VSGSNVQAAGLSADMAKSPAFLSVSESGSRSFRLWTLDLGLWTLDFGLWTLDFEPWTLDLEPRTLDFGLWTLDFGLWTLDFGLWTLDSFFCPPPAAQNLTQKPLANENFLNYITAYMQLLLIPARRNTARKKISRTHRSCMHFYRNIGHGSLGQVY